MIPDHARRSTVAEKPASSCWIRTIRRDDRSDIEGASIGTALHCGTGFDGAWPTGPADRVAVAGGPGIPCLPRDVSSP